MNHVVLGGDSIFDNAAYLQGSPDFITHLDSILLPDWEATLRVVDGSISTGVIGQLHNIPKTTTHLIVSAGGNDSLSRADILQRPATSVASAVEQWAVIRSEFQEKYHRLLKWLLAFKKPLAVCTVSEPNFLTR